MDLQIIKKKQPSILTRSSSLTWRTPVRCGHGCTELSPVMRSLSLKRRKWQYRLHHNVALAQWKLSLLVNIWTNIEYEHTKSAQCRLIKTNTERLIARLEVEQQGYRRFLNTIVCQPITLGTTLHREQGTESNRSQGQVKYESIVAYTPPQTNTVTFEHSVTKKNAVVVFKE